MKKKKKKKIKKYIYMNIVREKEGEENARYIAPYSDYALQNWIGMQAYESLTDLSEFKNEFITVG